MEILNPIQIGSMCGRFTSLPQHLENEYHPVPYMDPMGTTHDFALKRNNSPICTLPKALEPKSAGVGVQLYRSHHTTNPNNALLRGIPSKLPYICIV